MVIKNLKDLEKKITPKFKAAIKNAQNKSMDRFIDRANAFYADLPQGEISYQRTLQLNNEGGNHKFIDKSELKKIGNGYEAEVSLNPDALSYDTGARPSGDLVVGAAVEGWHGAQGMTIVGGHTDVRLWDERFQEMATDDLVEALIAQGLPIKKG